MTDIKALELSNKDIQMTKGLAILSMLFLHLFCGVKNKGFMGVPLLTFSDGTPFLYYIGWLSAICAPLFCVCNGYAHYKQGQIGGLTKKKVFKRYLKFMSCFAISVLVVCVLGMIFGGAEIPGNLPKFILNLFALDYSYTGIWWYAWFYVCYVFLSPYFFKLINKVSVKLVIMFVLFQFFVVEGMQKEIPNLLAGTFYFKIYDHLYYLFGARMLCYIGGMLLAKYSVMTLLKTKYGKLSNRLKDLLLFMALLLSSVLLCLLSKGILLIFYALVVFVIFNLFHKGKVVTRAFTWLGKQSLYIWLLHPFVCYSTFPVLRDWLMSFKYSIMIFFVLIIVCSIVSVVLNSISDRIIKYVAKI